MDGLHLYGYTDGTCAVCACELDPREMEEDNIIAHVNLGEELENFESHAMDALLAIHWMDTEMYGPKQGRTALEYLLSIAFGAGLEKNKSVTA